MRSPNKLKSKIVLNSMRNSITIESGCGSPNSDGEYPSQLKFREPSPPMYMSPIAQQTDRHLKLKLKIENRSTKEYIKKMELQKKKVMKNMQQMKKLQ